MQDAGYGGRPVGLLRRSRQAVAWCAGQVSDRSGSLDWVDRGSESGKLEGLPRRALLWGLMVGVRFLRTQQRVKSQCLFFLDGSCVLGAVLSSFEDFFEAVHGSFSSPSGVVCLLGSVFCLGLACLPCCLGWVGLLCLDGEFDPGSGRTLAACLTHASRAGAIQWQHGGSPSGERVSNT